MSKQQERIKGMSEPARDPIRCACVSLSAYDCWRFRYNLPLRKSVDEDGGPCRCPCHDEDEEDWSLD